MFFSLGFFFLSSQIIISSGLLSVVHDCIRTLQFVINWWEGVWEITFQILGLLYFFKY